MDGMEKYLDFAKEIAYEARKIIKKYFTEDNGTVISNSLVHSEVVDVISKSLNR